MAIDRLPRKADVNRLRQEVRAFLKTYGDSRQYADTVDALKVADKHLGEATGKSERESPGERTAREAREESSSAGRDAVNAAVGDRASRQRNAPFHQRERAREMALTANTEGGSDE